MKTCVEIQQYVSEYIDNQLDDAGTSEMFFHLGECQECRDFMTSLLQLRSAIRETAAPVPLKRGVRSLWRRRLSVSYAAAAVIAFVVLAAGAAAFQRIAHSPKIVEKTQTEYVYMTSFPPVYAVDNLSQQIKQKN